MPSGNSAINKTNNHYTASGGSVRAYLNLASLPLKKFNTDRCFRLIYHRHLADNSSLVQLSVRFHLMPLDYHMDRFPFKLYMINFLEPRKFIAQTACTFYDNQIVYLY